LRPQSFLARFPIRRHRYGANLENAQRSWWRGLPVSLNRFTNPRAESKNKNQAEAFFLKKEPKTFIRSGTA